MTQEIIEMARQAGMVYREFQDEFANANTDGVDLKTIEAFAKLVSDAAAAKERERIFDMLHEMHVKAKGRHNYYLHAVVTLKQRGEE